MIQATVFVVVEATLTRFLFFALTRLPDSLDAIAFGRSWLAADKQGHDGLEHHLGLHFSHCPSVFLVRHAAGGALSIATYLFRLAYSLFNLISEIMSVPMLHTR